MWTSLSNLAALFLDLLESTLHYFTSSVCISWGKKIILYDYNCISSVQFSHSVVSNSLQPHGLQHARLPWLSPTSRLAQTHVHGVGDAIQPSHPLLSPSPPAFNLSQHQYLFQWVGSSHQVAKVLELQLQHQEMRCRNLLHSYNEKVVLAQR